MSTSKQIKEVVDHLASFLSSREEISQWGIKPKKKVFINCHCIFIFIFKTKSQQANVKAHEAVDHQTSFMPSREEFSHS